MIIDFHTHIFPRAIRDNREAYFPPEPAFALLYDNPGAKMVGAADIVAAMDQQGVDKSVIFGFPWQNSQTSTINNDYIIESVDRYPQRLIGFCCLDPFSPDAAAEAARCLEAGLSGIGELAFYQSGIDDNTLDALAPLMDICRDKNLPLMIHTNEPIGHIYPGKTPNTLRQIYNLVKRFPKNNIVLAHWGGGIFFFNLLKKEVKKIFEHVYFDTAASPFLYDPVIYRYAKEIVGLDKILFGSDFPLLKPARYFKELETSGLPESDIKAICGLNAAYLLTL
jgi:predicted TIM-barrel fold metal-dependent hydrolase